MFATAFAISMLAGLSTGLGGVIVALKGNIGDRFLAGSLGFSAGVMVYISLVELLPEAMDSLRSGWTAIAAFFAGVALIAVIDRLVPDDIARVVVFMSSDEAGAITNQHYVVDGGWT